MVATYDSEALRRNKKTFRKYYIAQQYVFYVILCWLFLRAQDPQTTFNFHTETQNYLTFGAEKIVGWPEAEIVHVAM